MAGESAKPTASNASRARKRVEAESAVLKRARDGSAFTRCEACNKNVPVVLIDMHSCSLDSKIRMNLEAQVVEKAVEISKTERKRLASSAGKGRSAKKGKTGGGAKKGGKRPQTAFFLFMADFRKEYKAAHPDSKNVAAVAKEGGERWKSMTDEEKKPYLDKAAELKAQYENGEGSGENKVAGKEEEQEQEQEQEVDQPGKPGPYDDTDEDDDDYNDDNDEAEKPEDEKNELDDDLDDDM